MSSEKFVNVFPNILDQKKKKKLLSITISFESFIEHGANYFENFTLLDI